MERQELIQESLFFKELFEAKNTILNCSLCGVEITKNTKVLNEKDEILCEECKL